MTSHTYVFSCFCNSSIQSSPWTTRKRNNRRSNENVQPSQTALMVLWRTCFPIWNCCQVFLSKDLCIPLSQRLRWWSKLALSLLCLRSAFFKIHEMRIRSYISIVMNSWDTQLRSKYENEISDRIPLFLVFMSKKVPSRAILILLSCRAISILTKMLKGSISLKIRLWNSILKALKSISYKPADDLSRLCLLLPMPDDSIRWNILAKVYLITLKCIFHFIMLFQINTYRTLEINQNTGYAHVSLFTYTL